MCVWLCVCICESVIVSMCLISTYVWGRPAYTTPLAWTFRETQWYEFTSQPWNWLKGKVSPFSLWGLKPVKSSLNAPECSLTPLSKDVALLSFSEYADMAEDFGVWKGQRGRQGERDTMWARHSGPVQGEARDSFPSIHLPHLSPWTQPELSDMWSLLKLKTIVFCSPRIVSGITIAGKSSHIPTVLVSVLVSFPPPCRSTWENQFIRRQGSVWLTVQRVQSAGSWLHHFGHGEAEHHGGRVWRSKPARSMMCRKQRERGGGRAPRPLQGPPPVT